MMLNDAWDAGGPLYTAINHLGQRISCHVSFSNLKMQQGPAASKQQSDTKSLCSHILMHQQYAWHMCTTPCLVCDTIPVTWKAACTIYSCAQDTILFLDSLQLCCSSSYSKLGAVRQQGTWSLTSRRNNAKWPKPQPAMIRTRANLRRCSGEATAAKA